MTLRSRCIHRMALLAVTVSASLLLAAQAQARPEQLRWTHPRPSDVQDFEARVQSPDNSDSSIVSLSMPTPVNGIYSTTIEVGTGDKLISIRAIGSGPDDVSVWSTPPQLRTAPADEGTVAVGPGTTITPTPGATYNAAFSSSPTGPSVEGWRDTRANFSLQENDSLFRVTVLDGNRVLHTASAADDIHSHLIGSDRIWSDYQLRGRMAIDHDDAAIGVTAYSMFTTATDYYRLGRSPGGAFRIEGRPGILCQTPPNPVTPVPGQWYRFEFDVQDIGSSNQVRAKVWRQGDAEPSSYGLNCVDGSSGRPTGGRIGVWSGGGGQKYWDDLGVIVAESGGGGSPAPPAPPVLIQIIPVEP